MRKLIELDGVPIEVSWKKNMTKINLRVCIPHGEVKISAPVGVSIEEIQNLFLPKMNRVKQMVTHTKEKMKDKCRQYNDGERFQILGETYTLKTKMVQKSSRLPYIRHENLIMEKFPNETIEISEKRMKLFYQNQLIKISDPMLQKWSNIIGVQVHKITYKHMKTRWGSCSSCGHISLNVSLCKLPLELIEHVIVHELCHLVEANHSKRFYALMKKHLPNSEKEDLRIKQMDPLF
ncbi:MAG TPA: SprT family zinc-dependent metalloprotease [Bacteroidaceae bacterium]|nr:SprT family zinc-dependent metalloprotease [Bacteroidaceae bacterium]